MRVLPSFFESISPSFFRRKKVHAPLPLPQNIAQTLANPNTYAITVMEDRFREEWIRRLARIPEPAEPVTPFDRPHLNAVERFIPALGNLFSKVFSANARSRPLTNLYEIHCVVWIYIHFFNLLYLGGKAIAKMTATRRQAFIINGTILSAGILAAWFYSKLNRGPEHIEYCKRLKINKIPFFRRYNYNSINGGAVVVHGEPGARKTTFLQGIAAAFPHKKVFQIENLKTFGKDLAGNPRERLGYILDEVRRDPANSILIWDELGVGVEQNSEPLTNDDKVHLKLVSDALIESEGLTVVLAMYLQQWDLICKNATFPARFTEISMTKPEGEEALELLEMIADEEAPHLRISSAALKILLDHSYQDKSLGQFRNAVKKLRSLIGIVTQNRIQLPLPKELEIARQKANLVALRGNRIDSELNDPSRLEREMRSRAQLPVIPEKTIEELEQEFTEQQTSAREVVNLQNILASRLQERNRLARSWVSSRDQEEKDRLATQLDYIHKQERVALEAQLAQLKPALKGVPLEIDIEEVRQFTLQK